MNSYLHLIKWLIEHTELTEEITISAEELKQHYLKNNVPEFISNNRNINSKIGSFLYIIYGTDLAKSEDKPKKYNVKYSAEGVKSVVIFDVVEGADLIE